MVVNFNNVNMKEQPVLILRNADGTAIQTLGYAFNLKVNICYNEPSNIEFDIPATVDGTPTPHYDELIGMRIVDMAGWGQFVLINPTVSKTGVKEIKHCKANSLEYELTYKKMSLPENTYNFWNPVSPDETIIGIILSYLPSWSVGAVDPALVGKYRTFSEENVNIYNFIKSTAQNTYQCVFDFDTYNRKIYVRSTASDAHTTPVFISLDNLAKEITIDEDTENIFTRLDVNGAEGVDIRNVNPMGNNKIYNLDYFMTPSHFSQNMIGRWEAWKASFARNQLLFYNTSVEAALKQSAISTEQAALAELTGKDLASLENQQAVHIQYLASLTNTSTADYRNCQRDLDSVNALIREKEREIASQKALISSLEAQRDALTAQQKAIQRDVAFENFFTADEIKILDRYFKEDSIQDSAFVVSNVDAYTGDGVSDIIGNLTVSFRDGAVTKIPGIAGKDLYTVKGGSVRYQQNASILNAEVISASLERSTADNAFVMSVFLGSGTINGTRYPGGSLSMTGLCRSVSDNTAGDGVLTGTSLDVETRSGKMYFTQDTTEYERTAVAWELYDYGTECLQKLAYPSFSFDVSAANFLALDDFVSFATKLELGQRVYLELGDGKVLQPILIGIEADFEDLSSFKLRFGDRYSLSDSKFQLVDLLEQSISMGKTVDISKLNYNAFIESGASTAVKDFMSAALDVSKNAVLSGNNMAISWDSSGMRFRKYTGNGDYEPEQIGIINNSIVFTDDNWATAKMAIGKFIDKNAGETWGVVAPNLVGTLLAGENLVIESAKQDGGKAVFRVDANGAKLYNSTFDILSANGTQITISPEHGFAIGRNPIYNSNGAINQSNAKFWVDTSGNIHFKGKLEGADGVFNGDIYAERGFFGGELRAATGTFSGNLQAAGGTFNGDISAAKGIFKGVVQASKFLDLNGNNMLNGNYKFTHDYLELKNLRVYDNYGNTTFRIDSSGNVTMQGNITLGPNSYIDWNYVNSDPQIRNVKNTADNAARDAETAKGDVYRLANGEYYYGGTFIDGTTIKAPFIEGGEIDGAIIKFGGFGTMMQGRGFDGVRQTNIVQISSDYGMALEAYSGIRIGANDRSTVWFPGSIQVRINGYYYDLGSTLSRIGEAAGVYL